MRDVPKAQGQRTDLQLVATVGPKSKTEAIAAMMGMTEAKDKGKVEHMIKRFETLAAHPEIVAQAKASGGDRRSENFKNNTDVTFEKQKDGSTTWAHRCTEVY